MVRLKEIIKERRESLVKTERSAETFNSPNWSHMQAHTNGMVHILDFVTELLNFTE